MSAGVTSPLGGGEWTEESLGALGLTGATGKMVLKKKALQEGLSAVLSAVSVRECDTKTGNLYLQVARELQDSKKEFAPVLGEYIAAGKLPDAARVGAAIKFVNDISAVDGALDRAGLEAASGVGVDVTAEEVEKAVNGVIEANRDELVEKRYAFPVMTLPQSLLSDDRLRWAAKEVMTTFQAKLTELLGPKTAQDKKDEKEAKKRFAKEKGEKDKRAAKQAAKPAAGKGGAAEVESGAASGGGAAEEEEGEGAIVRAFQARDLKSALNTEELLSLHREETAGVIRTRFPPEPNGYLHIGHAKSMNLNFNHAFKLLRVPGGDTIFRYDDTNPEAESHEYIESQERDLRWLGWKPCRVTFSSDYFGELYDFAEQLIRQGDAYVCHQTRAEMEQSRLWAGPPGTQAGTQAARGGGATLADPGSPNSPWRDRPVAESLKEFRRMRDGLYGEGEATLRLKMDMTSANPVMWDPVAYRVKLTPHPRTGDKWVIYPSYDYTHCIVDSLEHIDYSLCTLEFESRRDSYYWLLEKLSLWRPAVWEMSRLNITHGVLSKRRIIKLIAGGVVRGWDDPRLLTISGLRRRGFSPQVLNSFCTAVGVTRSANLIAWARLENEARAVLNTVVPRLFLLPHPVPVRITGVIPAGGVEPEPAPGSAEGGGGAGEGAGGSVRLGSDPIATISADWFPQLSGDDSGTALDAAGMPTDFHPALRAALEQGGVCGKRTLKLGYTVYVDAADIRTAASATKDFFGMAPGRTVGLRYAGNLRCTSVQVNEAGDVVGAEAIYEVERSVKPKGNLTWLSEGYRSEARLYETLFSHPTPGARTGSWEDDINPDSEQVCASALLEPSAGRLLAAVAAAEDVSSFDLRFQAERLGFFVLDKDTAGAAGGDWLFEGAPVLNRIVTLKASKN